MYYATIWGDVIYDFNKIADGNIIYSFNSKKDDIPAEKYIIHLSCLSLTVALAQLQQTELHKHTLSPTLCDVCQLRVWH